MASWILLDCALPSLEPLPAQVEIFDCKELKSKPSSCAGARVIEDCPVTAIDTEPSFLGNRQVSAVQTQKGTIRTKCVINCTGK